MKIKESIIILSLTALLAACSSGGSVGEESAKHVAGEKISLSSGDKIIKNEENTSVEISHKLEAGQKELTVLSGSISLVKGNYSVE